MSAPASEIANRLIDTITGRFFRLASFPYVGRPREDDFGPGYRSVAVGGVSPFIVSKTRICLRDSRLPRHHDGGKI